MGNENQQQTEQAIAKKIKNIKNVLSSAGIGATDYLTQLTYILFLKMDAEREGYGFESSIPEGYKWNDLCNLNGEDLINKYEAILEKLSNESGLIGTIFTKAQNKIDKPVMLGKVIDMVGEQNWYVMAGDVKGVIYESELEKNGQDKKSGAGQYFTPRPLIKTIVDVVDPKIMETVADPACGTGGFILGAYEHMKDQSKEFEKLDFLKKYTFFGADITPLVVTLASMNMYLHNIGGDESPIKCMDSLTDVTKDVYDVILANPPFGTRAAGSVEVSTARPDFIPTSDNQVNFLQHIMSLVKTGGRVGVVVPDSVLTGGGPTAKVRDKLLKEFNLHTILRLPTGIFYSQGVKTVVLFFEKGTPTENIWIYDYREGIRHTLVSNPLKFDDLSEFRTCYCSGHMQDRRETYSEGDPNGRWRKYSIEQVYRSPDHEIDFKWLNCEGGDDRTLSELLICMKDDASDILDAVTKISEFLKIVE